MVNEFDAHLEGLGRNWRGHLEKLMERIPAILAVQEGSSTGRVIGYYGGFPNDTYHVEVQVSHIGGHQANPQYEASIIISRFGVDDESWVLPSPVEVFGKLKERYDRQQRLVEEAKKRSAAAQS